MRWIRLCLAIALLSTMGCRREQASTQPAGAPSPRIVTYAPSTTDLAFDMGLGENVVGVTKWCILPAGQSRPVVGDAAQVNAESLLAVKPDIIFHDIDESRFDGFRRLVPSVKIIRLRARTLDELRTSIETMGQAVGREDLAAVLRKRLDEQFEELAQAVADWPRPRVLFVLGTEHPSTPGADTLSGELIVAAGGVNAAAEAGLKGWTNINAEAVLKMQPDVLICQVTYEQERAAARQYWANMPGLKAAETNRVHVTADRRLTFPGSGVARNARVLAEMIHPQAFEGAAQP